MIKEHHVSAFNGHVHCIVVRLRSLITCCHSVKTVSLWFFVILWPLLVSVAVTVESKPHPLECDWHLSCVSKATRLWKLCGWNTSPPLRWWIWLQAPRTIWGFTPMSSTASPANLSPLRPMQVRPHLARWSRSSGQPGCSGYTSVSTNDYSNSVRAGWGHGDHWRVLTACMLHTGGGGD